jgi:hypothetical protein
MTDHTCELDSWRGQHCIHCKRAPDELLSEEVIQLREMLAFKLDSTWFTIVTPGRWLLIDESNKALLGSYATFDLATAAQDDIVAEGFEVGRVETAVLVQGISISETIEDTLAAVKRAAQLLEKVSELSQHLSSQFPKLREILNV